MPHIDRHEEYAEEVGGVFSCEDLEAIPFNHWKKDCEWLILLLDLADDTTFFIPVRARTAREACAVAFHNYSYHLEEEDDI